MDAIDLTPFSPVSLISPGFSLYPCRASLSITADLFSSLPQKDNITGMLNVLFVPEWTTLMQKKMTHRHKKSFNITVVALDLCCRDNNFQIVEN